MKMKKTLILALLLAAVLPALSFSQEAVPASAGDPMAGSGPFSDPAFQDMLETSDGYLTSANTMKVRTDFGDFRDAPVSAPAPTLKNPAPAKAAAKPVLARTEPAAAYPGGHYKVTFAGESGPVGSFVWPIGSGPGGYAREYVFMSVTPAGKDYSAMLSRLESECGFRFAGEKTFYNGDSRRTVVLGWAPAANITRISAVKGVLKAAVEKRSAGVPLKTRVRFTLKVPYQNKPSAFVPDFIKRISDENGFSTETWFRVQQSGGDSKFTVFDVTGSLPVDMVGELSRSPFVASVEFHDASL
jgi:hypothetical protein